LDQVFVGNTVLQPQALAEKVETRYDGVKIKPAYEKEEE
jgi:hypothetical protein